MTWDNIFLDIAKNLANGSKCVSHSVGCIIVKDNRIISSGVNGSPSGYTNCNDKFPNYDRNNHTEEERLVHRNWSILHEIHAEMNAIISASIFGISIKDSSFYVTMTPCSNCLKNMIALGVKNIYIDKLYDGTDNIALIDFTDRNNMNIFKKHKFDSSFIKLTPTNIRAVEKGILC